MASFMDTYLDAQSNFSDDINLYSEGFRFDEQDMDFIEGQIALREVPILLEKEEIISRMNLYGEAAGGILAGLFTFIKSAIALMIKIFLGFKGIIIAVIVALIGRFIIKKFKGGSVSYSGGGYTASSSPNSGVPAVASVNRARNILSQGASSARVREQAENIGLSNEYLEALSSKSKKGKGTVADAIAAELANNIRVEIDEANSVAMYLPKEIKADFIKARMAIQLKANQRVAEAGSYDEILSENPFWLFDNITDAESSIENIPGKISFCDFIIDCLRHYDGLVAAAYMAQLGVVTNVYKAVAVYKIEEFQSIINDIKNDIPAESIRNIEALANQMKEYNGLTQSDKYFKDILSHIPNKYKPNLASRYIKIADALGKFSKGKYVKSVEDANITVQTINISEHGVIMDVKYGDKRDKEIEFICIKKFKEHFSDGFDLSKLKTALGKLTDLGKSTQAYVADFESTAAHNQKEVNIANCKNVAETATSMISCCAHSVNIMSKFLKNTTNPIHKAIHDDIVMLSLMEYTKNEMKNYVDPEKLKNL